MFSLLAALAASAQPGPASPAPDLGRTAWIFSTVGHSEFCPAGNVIVDLTTGRFDLTPRAPRHVCEKAGLERPRKKGRLAGMRLAELRAAYLQALSEGLESQACQEGNQPKDIVIISNGGTPVLVVTSGRGSLSAPDDLTCWSKAANALYDHLDEAFESYQQR
jgi:hypothetical protein